MQNTEISFAIKLENLCTKSLIVLIFLIFNIFVHTVSLIAWEPVLASTHNLCFGAINE